MTEAAAIKSNSEGHGIAVSLPCSMPRIKYKKKHIVTSVVAVIVDDEDRVLLTKRCIAPFKGLWVMPGGKIDLGEPILKALHREVMEEVGLEVEVEDLIGVFEHLTPGEKTAILSSSTTCAGLFTA